MSAIVGLFSVYVTDKGQPTYIGCAYQRAWLCAWYIVYRRQVIVVSYLDPPGMEVIAMGRRVLHQFDNTNQHFVMPNYLTTSTDGFIYVSDSKKDRITKLDSSVNVIKTQSSTFLCTGSTRRRISKQETTTSRQKKQ